MPTLHADGQLALFTPTSTWHPPVGPLPMLANIDIGLDTETRDNGLANDRGPGWVRRDGYICGVSVAWEDRAIYVPVRHPDTECRPIQEVIAWIEHLLRHCRVHFFNVSYDMGWLQAEGCTVWPERAEDGGTMAFITDENYSTYNLEDCCARAGIPGKDETLLREAAASLGIQPKSGSIKHGIWRMPARFVGPYAEQDAASTLQLCKRTMPILEEEGTVDAYRTEMDLYPVTNAMRWRGIRVSTDEIEKSQKIVQRLEIETLEEVDTPWRRRCTIDDIRSPKKLAELFDAENLPYPRTPKTNEPSFQAQWLEQLEHPLGKKIRRARKLHDLWEKFLGTYILGFEHLGRIHAEIRQLRAVTHRFSYSNPPLQQMPSRDEELAPLVRNAFLPEDGEQWLASDFKNQEPRLIIHFSYLAQKHARKYGISMGDIEGTVRYYREDPNPDFHTLGASLMGITRKAAKDYNQGLTYRMSAHKLAGHLNIAKDEAEDIWNMYHERIPYISGIAKYAQRVAQDRGYVRMIDGARRHYPLWQPKSNREAGGFARLDAAQRQWPGQVLERAFAYQAGNAVTQGSAARQMKRAMVIVHNAGYKPLITLHDELGVSVSSPKMCEEIGELMCSAIKLVVPITVDLECGSSWGKAKTPYEKVQW